VHVHGDAWNALAHGRKRWVLFPPESAFYSTTSATEFFSKELPSICAKCTAAPSSDGCPLQLTQEAGDLLFVPREWGHAVLNILPSVGVAAEFDSAYSRSGEMK
jgi:oxalate decarboxylase/phosphoglucose isomerase-like protein (cupin superfamily)